jgi:hypothetical protein
MPLSWNEIRLRASNFVNEWQETAPKAREEADAHDFQTDFLNILGVTRRQVATFEHRVQIGAETDKKGEQTGGRRGYIDLFWKGRFMIEMKSPGKDRKKAYEQAKEYAETLPQKDLPQGILISDFLNFDYYDLEKDNELTSFTLADLPKMVELFSYLAGYKDIKFEAVDPVDIEAAERMGELHDALKDSGYAGHELEMYLVRLLFCLFADDSGIFEEKKIFYKYILEQTKEDGSDLALYLGQIFDTLNKPIEKRLKNIDETLNKFTYVNGQLFEEHLETAAFNSAMRKTLLKSCTLDWSLIKPEIFGAMFQSVKDKDKRRALGEHYTSEVNILKVIRPLFLDALWEEFEKIRKQKSAKRKHELLQFHTNLRKLKFLDPACGCGNFLVVTYRELRLLEIEILAELYPNQQVMDIQMLIWLDVDQFYGIEIEEFPARIAQTALWLMDHIMNNKVSERFGNYFARIPLKTSPTIVIANALRENGKELDWETIVPKNELTYILGNPPFLGSRIMNKEQKRDVEVVFDSMKNFGDLDYVTCWYKKAAEYIKSTNIEVAFVSTNSICQGLQVPILWPELINKYQIKINFAHQTFKWSNEAKGKAAVYCVIIGFRLSDRKEKSIFQYSTVTSEPMEAKAKQINPYLIDYDTIFITSRAKPICNVPQMNFGNMPADGGELLFTKEEKEKFIEKEPAADKYFKRFISAHEFLNKGERWCLWLVDIDPSDLKRLNLVYERVKNIKSIREKSARPFLADVPHLFAQITQPKNKDYILIPRHSSENRTYIPMGFFTSENIAADSCLIIPEGTNYHFGILTSSMHMAWTRYVCGRLKSDYRYSKDIVYNNFPWPNPSDKQKSGIEELSQAVLDARNKFPNSSLADLYDPVAMPPVLLKAHQKLDKAVEMAYGRAFDNDGQRVVYLFEQYQRLVGEFFIIEKKGGKLKKKK